MFVAGCRGSGDPSGDYGEGGHFALGFGFGYYGVEVGEDFGDGHGVDFAAGVIAFVDELPEVAAGDLGGELVGDDLAAYTKYLISIT